MFLPRLNKSTKIKLGLAYAAFLTWLLFFAPFRQDTETGVNFVPFRSIWDLTAYTFSSGHGIWHWIINVPGNVIAFIPLPFIYKLFRTSPTPGWLVILMLVSLPLLIECLQYVFQNGSCDVDDWLLNVTGLWIGILLLRKREYVS